MALLLQPRDLGISEGGAALVIAGAAALDGEVKAGGLVLIDVLVPRLDLDRLVVHAQLLALNSLIGRFMLTVVVKVVLLIALYEMTFDLSVADIATIARQPAVEDACVATCTAAMPANSEIPPIINWVCASFCSSRNATVSS